MTTAFATEVRKGGSWLLDQAAPDTVFTPERLTDEHRMMNRTALDFARQEVLAVLDRLEQKEWDLNRQLVRRAGELGLLGTDTPEEYGGLEVDKASSLVVAEGVAISASFATTFGAMTGLSIMPLLMFGTDEQKKKYLPGLVSGEIVGAYALSESGSGSDALGARAKAALQPDGSFRLSGEKMWITNCGFADLYIVFAKVDGEHFSAFIIERGFPGVSSGKEEHKMGLHGSSTAPLILQDVPVPKENLLGEIGKGHKVAFEVLNYGRFKLGAMCLGGTKNAIGEAARYAATRKQFGTAIANFGAIKHKLGEMVARTYALESLMYRTAGLIDVWMANEEGAHAAKLRGALEEFEVESSIAKVAGSEILDFVLDENVQIHGGNGFVSDYPAERHYRDARVNRIFEGTNEINRLLITGRLMRKALKGDLPLIAAARKLFDEIMTPGLAEPPGDGHLDAELAAVQAFKKVALLVLGAAMQKYGQKVQDEQEVLNAISDILIDLYAAESAVLRAQAANTLGNATAALQAAAATAYVSDAAARVELNAKTALAAMAEGDELRTQLAALRRVLKTTPANTIALRRQLADATVERGSYILG
ncbi:MAG: acyl-CoA dehydrogenase family protein [Vicinamibacteraceae bacterium]|nr:acyl-CoA dehydrogenase family protein [Vicinamibacteraceae bacterium]